MIPSLLSLLLPAAAPGNDRGLGAGNWDLQHLPGESLLSLQLRLEFGDINGRNYVFHQQGGILTPFQSSCTFMDKSQVISTDEGFSLPMSNAALKCQN